MVLSVNDVFVWSVAGPSAPRHHACSVRETETVQRHGQSLTQTHHEGERAQETRYTMQDQLVILFSYTSSFEHLY